MPIWPFNEKKEIKSGDLVRVLWGAFYADINRLEGKHGLVVDTFDDSRQFNTLINGRLHTLERSAIELVNAK